MTVDLSVFDKLKTKADFDRENEAFNLKKRLAVQKLTEANSGRNLPAALQIANEYAKARQSGDAQRMNDIALAAKSFDKGVVYGDDGNPVAMQGYGDAVGQIAGTKKSYEANAQNQSDLYYDPITAGREAQAKAEVELSSAPLIEQSKKEAAKRAERSTELGERLSSYPQLVDTAQQLSDLGKDATYTYRGRAWDALNREFGNTTKGAESRTEYIALVDNQVLPLLRQTFGAAFTVKEGESLRATLGDPNKTPTEKDAVLRSFINQKAQTINSMERELGLPETQFPEFSLQSTEVDDASPNMPKKGERRGDYMFVGGNPNDQSSWKRVK